MGLCHHIELTLINNWTKISPLSRLQPHSKLQLLQFTIAIQTQELSNEFTKGVNNLHLASDVSHSQQLQAEAQKLCC